jgi:hypothetical protein
MLLLQPWAESRWHRAGHATWTESRPLAGNGASGGCDRDDVEDPSCEFLASTLVRLPSSSSHCPHRHWSKARTTVTLGHGGHSRRIRRRPVSRRDEAVRCYRSRQRCVHSAFFCLVLHPECSVDPRQEKYFCSSTSPVPNRRSHSSPRLNPTFCFGEKEAL